MASSNTTSPLAESSGNVFEDLGRSPDQALSLMVRAQLMASLKRYIDAHGYSQRAAADALGTSQPRISDLTRGKIDRFTIDALLDMHAHAGLQVTIDVHEPDAA